MPPKKQEGKGEAEAGAPPAEAANKKAKKEKAPKEPKPAAAKGEKAPPKPKPAGGKGGAKPAAAAAAPAEEMPKFPMPQDNPQKTPELLQKHLAATGGLVVTRFPPEPNGYLHIGHAKAMNWNFGFAKARGGKTYLRFDDTNPEAEQPEFFQGIIENCHWLGHSPCEVTYSSAYFQELYDFAIVLIKKNLAYVDHQTKAQMIQYRKENKPSPWRERPIEESLKLFDDMRRGKFAEGAATLRMKMDLTSANSCLNSDLVAYRIKYAPHPAPCAGDKWCIYPSYDFTHCCIDSIENVTHSFCTLEFMVRHDSYMWLLDALEIFKPFLWEYSRLNVSNNVISKRKLHKLVKEGFISGWDDPRLLTLIGLRRRGYSAEAINAFCDAVGVSRAENLQPLALLELHCREEMDANCLRRFCVTHPLKVVITNINEDEVHNCEGPNFPKNPEKGSRTMPLSRVIYIDQADFRLVDSKDFFGLSVNKEVGLKYGPNITCSRVFLDAAGQPEFLEAVADFTKTRKPKGHLHWISEPKTPGQWCEVRLYDALFSVYDPKDLHDDWMQDLNPNSLEVCPHALVEPALINAPVGSRYQFERIGFFCVDKDSTPGRLVINRTTTLRDTYHK